MKVTLQIGGREMTFSESELIGILENHFANQKETHKQNEQKTIQKLVEGKCFEVNPKTINQELFSKRRKKLGQECTRQIILEAFSKVKEEPEKYGRPFKTMIMEKTWSSEMSLQELKEVAQVSGDHMADLYEQALEWAQRIANGEKWKSVCNEPDTADWYRLIKNRDHSGVLLVGGGLKCEDSSPKSNLSTFFPDFAQRQGTLSVPLVVIYEEH